MVTTSETTKILTQPKIQDLHQPSFKRWLKHFCFLPATKRYFDQQDQHAIVQAVTRAEQGHVGEIQVVIEGHIPAHQAYSQNTYARAQQLFAELGVWDTEHNSGVLLYLNLCERSVEIVIDRGIKNLTEQKVWQDICERMLTALKQGYYRDSVVNGVMEIGDVLGKFYEEVQVDKKNEIADLPVIL